MKKRIVFLVVIVFTLFITVEQSYALSFPNELTACYVDTSHTYTTYDSVMCKMPAGTSTTPQFDTDYVTFRFPDAIVQSIQNVYDINLHFGATVTVPSTMDLVWETFTFNSTSLNDAWVTYDIDQAWDSFYPTFVWVEFFQSSNLDSNDLTLLEDMFMNSSGFLVDNSDFIDINYYDGYDDGYEDGYDDGEIDGYNAAETYFDTNYDELPSYVSTIYPYIYNIGYDYAESYFNTNYDELPSYVTTIYPAIYNDGFNDGYDDAVSDDESKSALIRLPGEILGTFLSFALFVSTEFSILGVTLLSVGIAAATVAIVYIILKWIF